jgi:phospholipid N-methyltransferase
MSSIFIFLFKKKQLKEKFQNLKTALKFTLNLPTTGALFQTTKSAANEVCKYIEQDKIQTIIELGAGHGNITHVILKKMNQNSKLYVFEINADFCKILHKIKDDRLIIVNDSAERFDYYVKNKVDCIISTLPLTFIQNSIISTILTKCKLQLIENGKISQILYSTFHLKKYKAIFSKVSFHTNLSLPIEFIYHCEK